MANILEKAAKGNPKAIDALLEQTAGKAEVLAALLGGQAKPAKLAAQITEDLLLSLKNGSADASLHPLDLLLGTAVDTSRAQTERSNSKAFFTGNLEEASEMAELPAAGVYSGDAVKGIGCLAKAMQALTPAQRFAAVLTLLGQPAAKTGKLLSMTEGTVKALWNQALPLITAELEKQKKANYSIDIPQAGQLKEMVFKAMEIAVPTKACDQAVRAAAESFVVPVNKTLLMAGYGICALLIAAALVIFGKSYFAAKNTPAQVPASPSGDVMTAEIAIEDYGNIKLELRPDVAPITVENFVNLAKSGFYDGLTFHRIMEGFMMQGGDPDGNGQGGSGTEIKGEFAANGVENKLSHTRGAISMARNGFNMDSASSQFFIVHQDSTFLDGNYACFGYVTEGIDVVDRVCEASQPIDDNGTILPEDQPVIAYIRILE